MPVSGGGAADAVAVVDRAMEATGGLEAMRTKLSAWSAVSKGVYSGMPYEMTTYWKAPDNVVMDVSNGWMKMGYSKDDCWTSMNGVVADCMPDEKANVPETLGAFYVGNLYPLKDEGVTLVLKDEEEVNGKKAVVVEATVPGVPMPITFFFDTRSGLPVQYKYRTHFMGAVGEQIVLITAHADFDGLKLASKSVGIFEGKTVMEDEIVSIKYGLEDAKALARPEQAPLGVTAVRAVPEHQVLHALHKGPYESMGASIGKIFMCIGMNGLMPMGGPMMVYLKDPMQTDKPEEYETEVRLPVNPAPGTELKGPGCVLKTIPAMDIAVQLQKGPYDQVAKAYGDLATWTVANGYEISGPAMMSTFNDPRSTPSAELLSELYFPVKKKGE